MEEEEGQRCWEGVREACWEEGGRERGERGGGRQDRGRGEGRDGERVSRAYTTTRQYYLRASFAAPAHCTCAHPRQGAPGPSSPPLPAPLPR
eukprot:2860025-Rhodomonas_salina.2